MAASPVQAHSLGSYEVIRKLGSGGMAEVFLAAQHMAGDVQRMVVIKAMLPHLADDEHFVQMFMREARIAAVLSHPNIVQIHDVSVLDGRPCIVMEFLRGRDLWHVLRRTAKAGERIPATAAAAVVAQAASGLDYAHRKRDDRGRRLDLVHRDISPHNLFLTREGHVRLLDFGIAKSRYQQQRTESGVLKGKLPYMAPEQARGKEIDGRADQFALGVILWETLTARRLFAREDPFQTMNALFHMDLAAPSTVAPEVPPDLDHICLRALAREPAGRFETCEQLADALRDWLHRTTAEREPAVINAVLEHAVPSSEDKAFYGFDPDSTATSVELPAERSDEDSTLLRDRDGTPSHSGIGQVPTAPRGVSDAGTAPGAAHVVATAVARPSGGQTTDTGVTSAAPTDHWQPGTEPGARPVSAGPLLLVGGLFVLVALAAGVGVSFALLGGEAGEEPVATELPRVGEPGTGAGAATEAEPDPEPGDDTAEPAGAADDDPLEPIEIVFAEVPDDVRLEVEGERLDGEQLTTEPSDDVRHIRAVRDGREIWRYDGIFRQSTTVTLPDLPEADEPQHVVRREPDRAPRDRGGGSGSRMRSSMGSGTSSSMSRMRLGNELDLGYP